MTFIVIIHSAHTTTIAKLILVELCRQYQCFQSLVHIGTLIGFNLMEPLGPIAGIPTVKLFIVEVCHRGSYL